MNRMKDADVLDVQGNIVIATDLKVRHKDSQYEYTVDSVVPDESGKKMTNDERIRILIISQNMRKFI